MKEVAALCKRREEIAGRVDDLADQLAAAICQWLDLEQKLFEVHPGRTGTVGYQLGAQRVQALIFETMNRAGVRDDFAVSQRSSLRKASDQVRSDSKLLIAS